MRSVVAARGHHHHVVEFLVGKELTAQAERLGVLLVGGAVDERQEVLEREIDPERVSLHSR